MGGETLSNCNIFGWWLDQTPPEQIRQAVDQLYTWGSYKLDAPERLRHADAAWAMTNAPALDKLYSSIYPDASYAHDRLRILSLDLQTMAEHDKLLWQIDAQSAFARPLEDNLSRLLDGTEYSEALNIKSFISMDKIANSPSGLRRIRQGMSPGLKIMTARVRLDNPPTHLENEGWQHSNLWWRQLVVETLGLSPQDLEMTRRLGVTLENAAAD